MSVPTTGSSGPLHAEIINIKMDINDDDEDVVVTTVSISNEAPVPMGGLDVAVITHTGAKHHSQEGVTSLGPGVQRDWNFEFPLDSGEWTFVLKGSNEEVKMGPFSFDFEYSATQGRKLASTIGSSLFSGAFDQSLGDFGKVQEREMIDPTKVVLTSYAAENSEGGETLIKADIDLLSTGMTTTGGQNSRDAPILNPNPVREAPMSQPSRSEDPLLAHAPSSPSVRESPKSTTDDNVALPTSELTPLNSAPVEPSGPPSGPPGPPTPPTGPPTPPSGPPSGPPTPPTGPPAPPSGPPSGPPSPPSGPPSGPPTPPSGPPSGPPTPPSGPPGPPSGPPSGPPTAPPGPKGPPTGPPSGPPGPPATDPSKVANLPDKPNI